MCLTSKRRFPEKAKEDIVCFKIMDMLDVIGGKSYFTSPYFPDNTLTSVGGTLKAEGSSFKLFNAKEKGRGYIHAFIFVNLSSDTFSNLKYWCNRPVLLKCIIPKGTKCHYDKYSSAVCAKEIKIVELVKRLK